MIHIIVGITVVVLYCTTIAFLIGITLIKWHNRDKRKLRLIKQEEKK